MKPILRCFFLIPLMLHLAAIPAGTGENKDPVFRGYLAVQQGYLQDGPRILGHVVMKPRQRFPLLRQRLRE